MNPLHHRRSLRLKGYDYAKPGAYFVTICAQDRTYLFGDVLNSQMRLNEFGRIVQTAWNDLPNHYPNVEMDEFVIMPNHIHGIIIIVGAGFKPAPTKPAPTKNYGLPEIVRALKTFTARRINELRGTPGVPVWQRNYYEHIIRTEQALHAIRRYIMDNPIRWHLDRYNPDATGPDPQGRDLWEMLQNDARTSRGKQRGWIHTKDQPCARIMGTTVANTDNEYPSLDQSEDGL